MNKNLKDRFIHLLFNCLFKEAALLITSHATNKASPQKENTDNITCSYKLKKPKNINTRSKGKENEVG